MRPALPEEEPDIYDRDLLGADECCEHLPDLLIELKRKHVPLSAKHVCCIAFWAEGAGLKAAVGSPCDPTQQSLAGSSIRGRAQI